MAGEPFSTHEGQLDLAGLERVAAEDGHADIVAAIQGVRSAMSAPVEAV